MAWLDAQPRTSVWITAITVLEIRFGLQILPGGRRRTMLTSAFETVLEDKIEQRIAPFDAAAAEQAGTLMASRQKKGRPGELRDTMVAGIVLVHRATLVTGNSRHFSDLPVRLVNPWEQS